MRDALTRIGVPFVVGLVVLVAAWSYPGGQVHGTPATGPTRPTPSQPSGDRPALSASWAPRQDVILLSVTSRGRCALRVGGVTSTAPARVEVQLVPTAPCGGRMRPREFRVPPPAVARFGAVVRVMVGTRTLRVEGVQHG